MALGPAKPQRWEAGPSWGPRPLEQAAQGPVHPLPTAAILAPLGFLSYFPQKQQLGGQSVRFLQSRLTQPPGSPGSSLEEVVQLPAVPSGYCGHPRWSQGALRSLGETSGLPVPVPSPSPASQSPEAMVLRADSS